MSCGASCCGSCSGRGEAFPEQYPTIQPLIKDDKDSCCNEGNSTINKASVDACRDDQEHIQSLPDQASLGSSEQGEDCECCESIESEADKENDCCKPVDADASIRQDDCCSGPPDESQNGTGCTLKDVRLPDECCAPKSNNQACEGRDVPPLQSSQVEDKQNAPSCCKDKPSPCCDVSCLDRLALRDCENGKPPAQVGESSQCELDYHPSSTLIADTPISAYTTSRANSQCHQGKGGKPCGRHARAIHDRYAAMLEALGCICRALLALGQESCCAPRARLPVKRKGCSKGSFHSSPRASMDSCRSTGVMTVEHPSKLRPRMKNKRCDASPTVNSEACSTGCHENATTSCMTDSRIDTCCDKRDPKTSLTKSKETAPTISRAPDLEKGLSEKEHVVLSISGMTCTGCETKLKHTLETVQSVKNLKTSLVLARAEFDLDLCTESVAEVIKHLERTTEFKCERVTDQGSNLDLIVPGNPSDFVSQEWPDGILEMTAVNEHTVHVTFDPRIMGARDIAEKAWDTPVSLAAPRGDPTLEAGSKHVRHVGYMTVLSIVLTIPVLVLAWAPLAESELAYGSASLALATVVQFVIAGPFYPKALKSLRYSRMIEMDLLIVLSTTAAYVFSVVSFGYLVAGQPLSTGQFFETSTLLITLIMVGRYVSAFARQKAVESISVRSLQTPTAILLDESRGVEKEIDVRLLQHGDVFKVPPESTIPTDGTVISGSSEVDESMMTGESRPVEKHTKSPVVAGSINGSGTLIVRLTRLPGDNTISTIARMVDEAKLSKPKIQDIADRIASYFVPVVVCLTIITFAIWVAVGVALRKESGSEATVHAITYAITVLIVSCPCAIGLAVPMVIVVASGVAAERGVIFRSADSIEVACKAAHVVFDKTGTLTQGRPTVVVEDFVGSNVESSAALLLGLIGGIKHPVSTGVATHLKAKGVLPSAVTSPKTMTGKGVKGRASGSVLCAGNSHWLQLTSHPHVQAVLAQGYTAFCFTMNDSLAAVFGLEDSLHPDAHSTVRRLQERGISIHVLSGDDEGAVHSVGTKLGIPTANTRSRCTPADKQAYIQGLLTPPDRDTSASKFKRSTQPVVIFCGDGTNDAVALAQATIGVHMNEGTDVAKSAADVILVRPGLAGVLSMLAVSEKAMRRIKFNFGWSAVYNVVAVLFGAGAFVSVRIPPAFAGLGELVSVLPVIAAAVLLRWSKFDD